MAALSACLHLVALVAFLTTHLCVSVSVRISLNVDWVQSPTSTGIRGRWLNIWHRGMVIKSWLIFLVVHQSYTFLNWNSLEKFVLGQRMSASEARIHEVEESITKTYDELLREQARKEALNRTVETPSARFIQPRSIRMDSSQFDVTAARTIVHWLLAVEKCHVGASYRGR